MTLKIMTVVVIMSQFHGHHLFRVSVLVGVIVAQV